MLGLAKTELTAGKCSESKAVKQWRGKWKSLTIRPRSFAHLELGAAYQNEQAAREPVCLCAFADMRKKSSRGKSKSTTELLLPVFFVPTKHKSSTANLESPAAIECPLPSAQCPQNRRVCASLFPCRRTVAGVLDRRFLSFIQRDCRVNKAQNQFSFSFGWSPVFLYLTSFFFEAFPSQKLTVYGLRSTFVAYGVLPGANGEKDIRRTGSRGRCFTS